MKVHPQQLIPGCLIIKDVMGQTLTPIIPKNTVVEPIHLQVLKKFKVLEVEIANKLVNGDVFETDQQEVITEEQEMPFYEQYVDVVKKTEGLFKSWDHRSKVDVQKIRELIYPLIEQGENKSDVLLKMHHYNKPENYFYYHIVSMPVIATFLAKQLGYSSKERLNIALAAFLSDIGMLKDQEDIYLQNRNLTQEEFKKIRQHPVESYRFIENLPVHQDVKVAVLQHHERIDGSGYPMGVKADKIHPFANIIAVSDIFHAMTSERVYRRKQSPYKVVEELMKEHIDKLDMKVLNQLVKSIVNFSNGTQVKLSNNEYGTIVFTDERHPTRPLVKLAKDQEIINLIEDKSIYIEEIL
ncbi:HD-GYP domain-containing protein [Alkalibacillus haloalkaliphilus]|uniref:HD family phosphohydrolase n=1 Tax=Alkalibacillus haloalkaliphilus TaxID=94136 RepID=A0A511W0R4_9BACI|nr:HD-GYP domain-containing protein [Alkalibacillus haloalkaliphilus]GEN44677.1 HD family phosphohydrolase [Alkalibacillus haloalkaliphilus]